MINYIQSFVRDHVEGTFLPRFSNNSEAFASELSGNLEELCPWYYRHNYVLN